MRGEAEFDLDQVRESLHWSRRRKPRAVKKAGEMLAPITTHKECESCEAPCCFLMTITLAKCEELLLKKGKYPFEVEEIDLKFPPRKAHVLKRRKDGSCPHFDWKTRKCLVYDKRPEACKRWYCGKGMDPGEAINHHGNAWEWSLLPALEKWRTKMTKAQKEILIALNALGRRTFHAVSVITTERGKCNGNSAAMNVQRKRYEGITIKVVEELTRKGYADQINNGGLYYKISKKGQQAAAKLV
jgi:hypothetical protein